MTEYRQSGKAECYWRVTCVPLSITTRVWAESRGKAIYSQLLLAKEAGYRVKWTDFRAVQDGACE